jgi:hypothetical protein
VSLIYEPTRRGKAVKTTDDSPWLDQDKAETFMRVHILRHWDRECIVRFAKHLLGNECQECPKHNAPLERSARSDDTLRGDVGP